MLWLIARAYQNRVSCWGEYALQLTREDTHHCCVLAGALQHQANTFETALLSTSSWNKILFNDTNHLSAMHRLQDQRYVWQYMMQAILRCSVQSASTRCRTRDSTCSYHRSRLSVITVLQLLACSSISMNDLTGNVQEPLHSSTSKPPQAQEPEQSSTKRSIYPSLQRLNIYAIHSMVYSGPDDVPCHCCW